VSRFSGRGPTAIDDAQSHNYCEIMKNITVSVDDETYRRARITAAVQGKSVSAMVREYLGSLGSPPGDETVRQEAWQRLWEMVDACHVMVGPRPTRARTYGDRRLH
jgi:hypothetical protein